MRGNPGRSGSIGPRGDKGNQGDRGETGLTGLMGQKGDRGDQGNRGERGISGLEGKQGLKGERGVDVELKGVVDGILKGDQGEQGEQGRVGLQGLEGNIGQKGDIGPQGNKGEKGNEGEKGKQGDKGLEGPQGKQGNLGLRGDIGFTGAKGDKGDSGSQGKIGPKGAKGARGEEGEQGKMGVTNIIAGGTAFMPRNKRDATSAPTSSDDEQNGWLVGSRWWDTTNDKEYVCMDKTKGAAVWVETTASAGTQLTQEEVEDFVGGMVSGNTETGIAVTYDDSNGKLDFVVSTADIIADADNDTKIQVEEAADEDIIRFDAEGTEMMTIGKTEGVDIFFTADTNDEHAVELHVDAAAKGDVKAIDIDYITGAIAAGEDEAVILVNIDEIAANGGDVFGLEVLATDGSAAIYGMKAGAVVGPILQESGTFANPTTGTNDTPSTDVADMIDGSAGTNTTIFVAVNDYILIGAAAAFTEIEFIIETGAANPGIKPTFGYSTAGSHLFTPFSPVDGTDGFRNTGVVAWDAADLTSHAVNTDTGTFDIKITRTHAVAGSVSLFYAKTAATVVYSWDKDGDVSIKALSVGGNLDMNLNEILNFRSENVGSLPSSGNLGRIVYLTTDNCLYLDQG